MGWHGTDTEGCFCSVCKVSSLWVERDPWTITDMPFVSFHLPLKVLSLCVSCLLRRNAVQVLECGVTAPLWLQCPVQVTEFCPCHWPPPPGRKYFGEAPGSNRSGGRWPVVNHCLCKLAVLTIFSFCRVNCLQKGKNVRMCDFKRKRGRRAFRIFCLLRVW